MLLLRFWLNNKNCLEWWLLLVAAVAPTERSQTCLMEFRGNRALLARKSLILICILTFAQLFYLLVVAIQ